MTDEQMAISSILNVTKVDLPIRYVGVPLSSRKLNFNDREPLLAKVRQRLFGWKAKASSYAGSVELTKSTLSSFHLLRATVFMLPQAALHALDRHVRDFLWNC